MEPDQKKKKKDLQCLTKTGSLDPEISIIRKLDTHQKYHRRKNSTYFHKVVFIKRRGKQFNI
jgi:hypothetical protein